VGRRSYRGIAARRASSAAIAWCVVFGAFHLYWAWAGAAGFAEFSIPPNRTLALTRDPLYAAIHVGAVVMCPSAALIALAPLQPWSRRIAQRLLLTPLWIVCALFLVRGIGNPIQTALIRSGLVTFPSLNGSLEQARSQWLLLDLVVFPPWFILGGLAFSAEAWFARRCRETIGQRGEAG
jgi:hypothetical protein